MTIDIIVIGKDELAKGNEASADIKVDPLRLLSTFIAQCVPSPGDASMEATHFALHGPLTPEQRTAAEGMSSTFTTARWWRVENGKCQASWNGQNIGEALDYDKALQLVGLQRRVPKML